MSVTPKIFDGTMGKTDPQLKRKLPIYGFNNNGFNNPVMDFNWKTTGNLQKINPMKTQVLSTNQTAVRGVLPCKGVVSLGSVGGSVRSVRRMNIPYEGGLYPQTGYARNQDKGLAYSSEKPINQPLMPLADTFNVNLKNKLGQPK